MALWRTVLDVSASVVLLIAALIVITIGVLILRTASRTQNRVESTEPIPSQPINIEGSAFEGPQSAPLLVLEYSDFQCPVCRRFAAAVLPAIRENYVAFGKAALAFRHFPLTQKHPAAFPAAVAAECSRLQGRFWSLHDFLFQDPENLSIKTIESWAQKQKLNMAAYRACVADTGADVVRRQIAEARQLEVRGTPTVMVGINQGGKTLTVTTRFKGIPTVQALTDALEAADKSIRAALPENR